MKLPTGGQQSIWILPFLLCVLLTGTSISVDVNSIAKCLHFQYSIINHNPPTPYRGPVKYHSFYAQAKLHNGCSQNIPNSGWSLVFCHKTLVEFWYFNYNSGAYVVDISRGNMTLEYILGDTYSLTPNPKLFSEWKSGTTLDIIFHAKDESVSRYDACLNWYITNGTDSASIPSSTSPDRSFVPHLTSIFTNTRFPPNDLGVPSTPGDRYYFNTHDDFGRILKLPTYQVTSSDILPTPFSQTTASDSKSIPFNIKDWSVKIEDIRLKDLKDYLEDVLPNLSKSPTSNQIILAFKAFPVPEKEQYSLEIKAGVTKATIIIAGTDKPGVFYGIQSLRNILPTDGNGNINETVITDKPRYSYRGLRLDVASNFFPKATIYKLLKIMARLKMNKLQLIIANDYGVRVYIEGKSILTSVGGKRCHDRKERKCLMSQLGSDPNGNGVGSGHYSKKDYQDILKEAAKHHIEIIPEYKFDDEMRATAKALQEEERRTKQKLWPKLVFEPYKRNMLKEGRINPCDKLTLQFVEHIVKTFARYHQLAGVPLKKFGIGGNLDNVAPWLYTCYPNFNITNPKVPAHPYVDVKLDFTKSLMAVSKKYNIDFVGSEEYFTAFPSVCIRGKQCEAGPYSAFNVTKHYGGRKPYIIHTNPSSVITLPILDFYGGNVTNVTDDKFYTRYLHFKILGYKSILSFEDALTLNNKEEHDPDIPGDIGSFATPISPAAIHRLVPDGGCCNSYTCHPTAFCKLPHNIRTAPAGMQANMFTQRISSEKNLMLLLFPRLIWIAQKMWHKPLWEQSFAQPSFTRNRTLHWSIIPNERAKNQEYYKINSIIAAKWLKILADLQIHVRIPPPGIFFNVSWPEQVRYFTAFPGLIPQVWNPNAKDHNLDNWVDLDNATFIDAKKDTSYYFRLKAPFATGEKYGYSNVVRAFTNTLKQGNIYEYERRQKLAEFHKNKILRYPIEAYRHLSSNNGTNSFRILCNIPLTNTLPKLPCGPFGNITFSQTIPNRTPSQVGQNPANGRAPIARVPIGPNLSGNMALNPTGRGVPNSVGSGPHSRTNTGSNLNRNFATVG